jgi:hypothetical protein
MSVLVHLGVVGGDRRRGHLEARNDEVDRALELAQAEPSFGREAVGAALGRVERVEVDLELDAGHAPAQVVQGGSQLGRREGGPGQHPQR